LFVGNPKLNVPVAVGGAGFTSTGILTTSFTAPNPKLNLGTELADEFAEPLLPEEAEFADVVGAELAAPGFSCSQQMHLTRDISFWAMHASQSQLAAFCAATSCLNPESCLGASAADAGL